MSSFDPIVYSYSLIFSERIVACEDELKNMGLKMKTVFILEKKTEQKERLPGIYLIK